MRCQRKVVSPGSPVTVVDQPPTAFKKSIADEWVMPYRDVPSQRLTGLPRSQGQSKSVRAPAVSSYQTAWLFRHWNTGRGQRPCHGIIDSMMSDYPVW